MTSTKHPSTDAHSRAEDAYNAEETIDYVNHGTRAHLNTRAPVAHDHLRPAHPGCKTAKVRRIVEPRQYISRYPKPVGRTAWALHCAYNHNSERARGLEAELVVLLRGLGIEPEWRETTCRLCGFGIGGRDA